MRKYEVFNLAFIDKSKDERMGLKSTLSRNPHSSSNSLEQLTEPIINKKASFSINAIIEKSLA